MRFANKIFNVTLFIACIVGASVMFESDDDFFIWKKASQILLGVSAVWLVLSNAIKNTKNTN